jgi:hypothetical protein
MRITLLCALLLAASAVLLDRERLVEHVRLSRITGATQQGSFAARVPPLQ